MAQVETKSSSERILLIRTDRVGDVILTIPSANVVRDAFPSAHIAFFGQDYTAPLLAGHPAIDEVICYDKMGAHRGLSGYRRLVAQLRVLDFDTAIMFYPRPLLALALFHARIPNRIGPGYRWYSLLFNRRVYEHRKKGNKHELEHNLSLLSPLIDDETPNEIKFLLNAKAGSDTTSPSTVDEFQTAAYAIVHPGNGGSAPNLSPGQYGVIIRRLMDKTSWQIFVTGSEAEKPMVQDLVNTHKNGRIHNLAGKFDLNELAELISGAKVYFSTSTGPMHIANAMRTTVGAFFCPARPCSPRRWGPYSQPEAVVLPAVTACDHGKPRKCPNGNCLAQISEEAIRAFVDRRIDAAQQ